MTWCKCKKPVYGEHTVNHFTYRYCRKCLKPFKKKIKKPSGGFMKKKRKKYCEVSGCDTSCMNKAFALIKDVQCIGMDKPFWVCRCHKKELLKGDHYEVVK